jgi:hypothetical protein
MGISCCDPKALPQCETANCRTIPANTWIQIDIRHPSLVIVKGTSLGNYDKGPRFRFHPGRAPTTISGKACQYTMQGGGMFLPAPGTWWARHDSTGPIEVTVLDTYDASAFLAFARGGYSHAEHTAPTVGVVSTLVATANVDRSYLLLQNDSVNPVYIAYGVAAVLNAGIRVNPNGGAYEIGGASNWRGAVWGIAVAPSVMLVTEGT